MTQTLVQREITGEWIEVAQVHGREISLRVLHHFQYTHSGHSEHLMGNFAPSARFDLEEVRGEITWGSYTVQGARMT